ncbi:MAG: 50S ribosomal protein L21 [Desulfobacterales bacterium]|nr:50S ribosomal protein L21 [Desulfobacterales bacterium]
MKYAVIETGGKQYKVSEGEVFRFERLPGEIGQQIEFNKILLYSDGNMTQIGAPLVDNVTVNAKILEQHRDRKILVFKYKRRKRYRNKEGHRQYYTAVRINEILNQAASISLQKAQEA